MEDETTGWKISGKDSCLLGRCKAYVDLCDIASLAPWASLEQISMTTSLSSFILSANNAHRAPWERAISRLPLLEREWENIVFYSRWLARDLSPLIYVTCFSFVDSNWWWCISSRPSPKVWIWDHTDASIPSPQLCRSLLLSYSEMQTPAAATQFKTIQLHQESHRQAVISRHVHMETPGDWVLLRRMHWYSRNSSSVAGHLQTLLERWQNSPKNHSAWSVV